MGFNGDFPLDRERLLSKISRDPTVGSLRDKKGSCSTQRGLRVGTDLRILDKHLEVGVSPYLGFVPSLSTLRMFELNEAVWGRLIGPKPWDQIDVNF